MILLYWIILGAVLFHRWGQLRVDCVDTGRSVASSQWQHILLKCGFLHMTSVFILIPMSRYGGWSHFVGLNITLETEQEHLE